MVDAGACMDRILDLVERNFLRMRCGITLERPGTDMGSLDLLKKRWVESSLAREKYVVAMAGAGRPRRRRVVVERRARARCSSPSWAIKRKAGLLRSHSASQNFGQGCRSDGVVQGVYAV